MLGLVFRLSVLFREEYQLIASAGPCVGVSMPKATRAGRCSLGGKAPAVLSMDQCLQQYLGQGADLVPVEGLQPPQAVEVHSSQAGPDWFWLLSWAQLSR